MTESVEVGTGWVKVHALSEDVQKRVVAAIKAALSQSSDTESVLVPREPTDVWVSALYDDYGVEARSIIKRVLAAAPPPPVGDAGAHLDRAARVIESHNAFDCAAGFTYVSASRQIAEALARSGLLSAPGEAQDWMKRAAATVISHLEEILINETGTDPRNWPGYDKAKADAEQGILNDIAKHAPKQEELVEALEKLRADAGRAFETVRHYVHMQLGKPKDGLPHVIEVSIDTNKLDLLEKFDTTLAKIRERR